MGIVLLYFIGIPALLAIVGYIIENVTDRETIKRSSTAWRRPENNNIPNFRSTSNTIRETAGELKELEHADVPDFSSIAEETEYHLEDITLEEIKSEYQEVEENTSFKHSKPTEDMEEEINELLNATSEAASFHANNSTEDIPPAEFTDGDERERLSMAEISPLGRNYYFVAKTYGPNIANMVNASPDYAEDIGVSYIMFGKIEGEFLNSFGESIKLKGLPENFEATDYMLIQGNFITAELFHVVEMISAEGASNGEEFEILNVAFS